jgi:hypothetical protein
VEIFLVIGFEEKFPTGHKDPLEGGEEILLKEAPFVVPGFRPGIWEKQVETVNRSQGQEPFHRVASLQAQDPQVGKPLALSPAADFPDPPKEPFDSQEIAVRVVFGQCEQERPVAAAQIHFEWAIAGE